MGTPYMGEIRIVSFNFAPKNWAQCNGQLLPISQNQALFSILGTTYGGNGVTTFALPDLRGRHPVHWGTHSSNRAFVHGEAGGAETVTLSTTTLAAHTHVPRAAAAGGQTAPTGNVWAPLTGGYTSTPDTVMAAECVTQSSGGVQAHDNMPPFLTLVYVIALTGIFPSHP